MTKRPGLGPVFAYEWLTNSRRWQVYAGRSAFVAALLAAMIVVWWSEVSARRMLTLRVVQAEVGQALYFAIVGTQLALVLLAAPTATAASICHDRARGTLAHLLVTDLSDAEIVLGKLAARLIPTLGFVACALPVMAIGTLLGGIDPVALSGAFLIALGLALLGASLALTLSVWASKTHEVLLATYAVWALWLLAVPVSELLPAWVGGAVPSWFERIDPFRLAFAPYTRPGSVGLGDHVGFFGVCVLLASGLAVVATWNVRAVSARQSGKRPRPRTSRVAAVLRRGLRRWPGPSLDGNPVLWREWHRNRPSRWGLACGMLYFVLAASFTAMALVQVLNGGGRRELAAWVNALQVAIGLLLLAVIAASALAEERARGSLDVLLATSLSTRAIVLGKWCGAYRMVPPLALLPGLLAFGLVCRYPDRWLAACLLVGLILSYGAALTSLGLALATWVTRPGRVVALTVSAHVLVTVGWFFLAVMISQHYSVAIGPFEASPFFGAAVLTEMIELGRGYPPDWGPNIAWAIVWIVVYTLAAIVLLLATLRTFDRCLGRISDRPGKPLPASKPEPEAEPILSLE